MKHFYLTNLRQALREFIGGVTHDRTYSLGANRRTQPGFLVLKLMLTIAITLLLTPLHAVAQVYSGPIVITKGGTYTGNWQSTDTEVPAVDVQTSEPVVIVNSNIRGAGYLIKSWYKSANITVRNTRGYGLTPTNWVGFEKPRHFVKVEGFKNIVVENCYMENTAGIILGLRYFGNGTENETIKIRYNKVKNIDGRIFGGTVKTNFVNLQYRGQVPHAEIAWNEVINEPNNSLVEDNINLYNARGTPSSPILIHNNYIQGAFPYPTYSADAEHYTGGGILLESPAENPNVQGLGRDSTATAFVKVFNNQVVNVLGYQYQIASGHTNEIYNNRGVTSSKLDNGQQIYTHNVGLKAYDYYKLGASYNNVVRDNYSAVGGWWNNNHFPDNSVTHYNNTTFHGNVTKQQEADEYNMWLQKISSNNIKIGVQPTGTGTTRVEAESNYVVLAETGTYEVTAMSISTRSGGAVVRLFDKGDKVRFPFQATAGEYIIKAHVRSGTDTDPTFYWSYYGFTLNGTSVTFTGDNSTLSAPESSLGGSTWGTRKSGIVTLNQGTNYLDVQSNGYWLAVDYIELVPASSGTLSTVTLTQAVKHDNQEFLVYPNPVQDALYIQSPGAQKEAAMSLWDNTGKPVVTRKKVMLSGSGTKVDLRGYGLKPGLYHLRIGTDSGERVYKLVVQ